MQISCIIYGHWEWYPMITMCYNYDAQYDKDEDENILRTWIHTQKSYPDIKPSLWGWVKGDFCVYLEKTRVYTDGLVWDCGIHQCYCTQCYCTGDTTALDWTIYMMRPMIYTIGSCRPPVAMLVITGGPILHRMPALIWVLLVLWLAWQWVSLWWPWLPHSEGGAAGIVWHLGWQTWTMLHLLHGATEGFR